MGFIELIIVVAVVVGIVRYVRSHPRQSAARIPVGGWHGELSWFLSPLIVLGTFVGISVWGGPPDRHVNLGPLPAPRLATTRPTSGRVQAEAERPEWTTEPVVSDGIRRWVVIASQQYTTEAEAEEELFKTARSLVLEDFRALHRTTSVWKTAWNPQLEDLRQHVIKERYAEKVDRDFGSFSHPMYRVWWQLEFSPEVHTELAPAWRRGLTQRRTLLVGGVASSCVALVSLMALSRRLDVVLHGQWRGLRRAGVTGLGGIWLVGIVAGAKYWLT